MFWWVHSYIQDSASPYSCWLVFVTSYNLLHEMCMTKSYMFLSCLIPSLTKPTKLIDVYCNRWLMTCEYCGMGASSLMTSPPKRTLSCEHVWCGQSMIFQYMYVVWLGNEREVSLSLLYGGHKSMHLKTWGKNSWFDCH